MASAERFELPLTESKSVVLPIRRNGNMETLAGVEPAILGLQPRALSTWLQSHMASAERVELPLSASETGVLPVRRSGNSEPLENILNKTLS